MKKKKIIIAVVLICVIIVAIAVAVFLINRNNEEEKTIEVAWGEKYYEILLEDSQKHTITIVGNETEEDKTEEVDYYENSKNANISIIDAEDDLDPIMVVSYEKNEHNCLAVYSAYEKDDSYLCNRIYYPSYEMQDEIDLNSDYEIKFLYNIEKEEYGWYIEHTFESNAKTFYPILFGLTDLEQSTETYAFTVEDLQTDQVDEDGTPVLSKFEQTFIEVDVDYKTVNIGDIHNINEKDLKTHIIDATQDFADTNKIVTEDVENETQDKITELEDKKEQIELVEEEKKKAEEEAQKQAEEEAKKKAEEQAAQGLKFGNTTLHYGTYVDGIGCGTFVINSDGTFKYTGDHYFNLSSNQTVSGTYYTDYRSYWAGEEISGEKSYVIVFKYNGIEKDFCVRDLEGDDTFLDSEALFEKQ